MSSASQLEIGVLITQLGGGLALFLYGMRRMTEALKTVAGGGMKKLLARMTVNRFAAATAGAAITAVIQSSSVTTVLVVGFVSAGLLTLSQSIGVILGANVGTTVTAQIIAFQVYKYGLLMIAVGFFTEVLARRERHRQWGTALMGLGLIFFGMELMSIATGPLREWPPFIDLMQNMASPLLAIAMGALFTAIVQSSSATTGIVIVLASQGLITLESGIGLIFGANIGTCVTAFISAVGRPREAMQAAWAHIVFNAGGVLLWALFIDQFADVVRVISPVSETMQGLERVAADTPRQIANAHTLFNVGNFLLFIGLTGPISKFVDRIVPERPAPPGLPPKYLDRLFLEQPAMALDQTRRELVRYGRFTQTMVERAFPIVVRGNDEEIRELTGADELSDELYRAIVRYLAALSQMPLVSPQPNQLQDFVSIANYIENIGDVIKKDLLEVATKRVRDNLTISESTRAGLRPLDAAVRDALDKAIDALDTGDTNAAMDAIESKQIVNGLAEDAAAHIAKRLVAEEPHRIENFQIETDIIENYRRINTLTRRIARSTLSATLAEGSKPRDADAA